MADKEKRLRKFLVKIRMRGQLKSVGNLEEARLILVEDPHSTAKNTFYDKVGYEKVLENGYTFSEDRVHFLVSTNPRNSRQVVQSVMTNKHGFVQFDLK